MAFPDMPTRRKDTLIDGCRPSLYGGNTLTSTGNSALDTIIGGGCPLGSIVLIEEDRYGNYSRVLSKYFLAEGVKRKHGIFLSTREEDPQQLLQSVPRPVDSTSTEAHAKGQVDNEASSSDDMRIAFRYNQLPKVESEISASSPSTTVAYDLSTSISEEDLNNLDITYCGDSKTSLVESLKEVAKKEIYSKSNSESTQNLLRICINSFGSPLWYTDTKFAHSLLSTLLQLKAIVRNTNSVCFITVPGHLLNSFDPQLILQIRNLVDVSIEIESFAASEKETNPVFKDYHGLLHIRKLAAVDTLAAYCPETSDLAFKLKRKRFVIEKLHLPPELGDSSSDSTKKPATMGCASTGGGSSGNHLLDF